MGGIAAIIIKKKGGVKKMARKEIEAVNFTITSPRRYEVTIRGEGGILFNKMPDLSITKAEKKNQEKVDPAELERKNWREKLYFESNNVVYIPGENLHQCLKDASKYWGQKIPGEGNKTFTDVVEKAVVVENLNLGVNKDDKAIMPFGKNVNGNPSKGKKSGAKVYKIRPLVVGWSGIFTIHVFDARLTMGVLKTILSYAGTFIGLGDWRPTYGRFVLVNIKEVEE
jgi:hypothetical protein